MDVTWIGHTPVGIRRVMETRVPFQPQLGQKIDWLEISNEEIPSQQKIPMVVTEVRLRRLKHKEWSYEVTLEMEDDED